MKGPFPYPGGKSVAADALIDLFPGGYRMYIEPFMGAASVYWSMKEGSFEQYILNDIDSQVSNFFHVLRERADELMAQMTQMFHSREEFARQIAIMKGKCGCGAACHGDFAQALNFLFLMKTAHNACPTSPGNFRSGKEGLKSLWNGDFDLRPYRNRLKGNVVLEHMDFEKLINRYDSPDSFIFADPPYLDLGNALYKHPFAEADHDRLAACLSKVKGKFLLTYNDREEIRSRYKQFNIMEASWSYNSCAGKTDSDTGDTSGDSCRVGKELVILNYEPLKDMPIFHQANGPRSGASSTGGAIRKTKNRTAPATKRGGMHTRTS